MNYKYRTYNLHTHSVYCGHGVGELSDYVREAKANNIKLLGFSEHCPVKENRWANSRMSYDTINTYLDDVENLKKQELINENLLEEKNKQVEIDNLFLLNKEEKQKNNKSIKILTAFECDYFKEYHQYIDELRERCDYLLFGVHYLNLPGEKDVQVHYYQLNDKALNVYTNQYIKSLETGFFSFAAHPDLFLSQYFKWDNQAKAISKEIIEAAIYYDVPLEVNGGGILKDKIKGFNGEMRYLYPVKEFWELAKSYDKLKIVSNADAHAPENIIKSINKCDQFAKDLNMEYRSANIDNINKTKKVEFV